jgi:MFS family permease
MYIAEITPAQYRGSFVTYSELGTNVGIILGLSAGLFFGDLAKEISWRFMYAMGGILPLLMIYVAKCVMAESPRWLMLKNQPEKAIDVLQKIYGAGT